MWIVFYCFYVLPDVPLILLAYRQAAVVQTGTLKVFNVLYISTIIILCIFKDD